MKSPSRPPRQPSRFGNEAAGSIPVGRTFIRPRVKCLLLTKPSARCSVHIDPQKDTRRQCWLDHDQCGRMWCPRNRDHFQELRRCAPARRHKCPSPRCPASPARAQLPAAAAWQLRASENGRSLACEAAPGPGRCDACAKTAAAHAFLSVARDLPRVAATSLPRRCPLLPHRNHACPKCARPLGKNPRVGCESRTCFRFSSDWSLSPHTLREGPWGGPTTRGGGTHSLTLANRRSRSVLVSPPRVANEAAPSLPMTDLTWRTHIGRHRWSRLCTGCRLWGSSMAS